MIILHITGSLALGGTETFIMNVYRELRIKGVIFDFLLFSDLKDGYYEEAVALGSNIYVLPERRKGLLKYNKGLNDFFCKYSAYYDVIHYSSCTLTDIAPLYYAKKYGIRTRIVHGHSSSWEGIHNYILHSINKHVLPYIATDFLACSSESLHFFYSKSRLQS